MVGGIEAGHQNLDPPGELLLVLPEVRDVLTNLDLRVGDAERDGDAL